MKSSPVVVVTFLIAAGCASQPWYEDAAAFAKDLRDWSLQKRTVADVVAVLEQKGFTCVATTREQQPYECSRRVEKFPCAQNQQVALEVDIRQSTVRDVIPFTTEDGRRPTACL